MRVLRRGGEGLGLLTGRGWGVGCAIGHGEPAGAGGGFRSRSAGGAGLGEDGPGGAHGFGAPAVASVELGEGIVEHGDQFGAAGPDGAAVLDDEVGPLGFVLAGGLDGGAEGPDRRGFVGGGEEGSALVEESLHALDFRLHIEFFEELEEFIEGDTDGSGDGGVGGLAIDEGFEDGVDGGWVGGLGLAHAGSMRTGFVWVKGFGRMFCRSRTSFSPHDLWWQLP